MIALLLSLTLTQAIIQVESGGNDNAIGDNGKALGCMQIWQCVWDDVKSKPELKGYTYQDVTNRKVAIMVFNAYMARYCTKKRLGREPTDEDRARCHNSGPNFFKKKHLTDGYWKKVKKVLDGAK